MKNKLLHETLVGPWYPIKCSSSRRSSWYSACPAPDRRCRRKRSQPPGWRADRKDWIPTAVAFCKAGAGSNDHDSSACLSVFRAHKCGSRWTRSAGAEPRPRRRACSILGGRSRTTPPLSAAAPSSWRSSGSRTWAGSGKPGWTWNLRETAAVRGARAAYLKTIQGDRESTTAGSMALTVLPTEGRSCKQVLDVLRLFVSTRNHDKVHFCAKVERHGWCRV